VVPVLAASPTREWAWAVVPGFVDCATYRRAEAPNARYAVGSGSVITVVRTTHPSFLESMRLFGVPPVAWQPVTEAA
jgi:hypothetical protein